MTRDSLLEIAALSATPCVSRVDDQIKDLVRDYRSVHPVFLAQIARVLSDPGTIMMSSTGDAIRVRFRSTKLTGRQRRLGVWQVILAVDLRCKTTIGLGYTNTPSRLPEIQMDNIWPVLRGAEARRATRFAVWAESVDVPHTIRVTQIAAARWSRVARYLGRYVPTITT